MSHCHEEIQTTCDCNTAPPMEKSSISPYFSIIFPIATLILGIVLNRFADSYLRNREMRKKGKRWIGELTFLKTPMKNQVKFLDEFLEDHKQDVFKTPSITGLVLMKTDRFKSMDRMDFLKYIESLVQDESKAIEKTNELLGLVEVVDSYGRKIEEVFNNYIKTASHHFEQWNIALNEYSRKCADLRTNLEREKGDFSKDKLLFPLFNLLDKQMYEPHRNGIDLELFAFQKNMIKESMLICEANRLDVRINELIPFLQRCNDHTDRIRLEKEYLSTNVSTIKIAIEKAHSKLEEYLENLAPINK
jgi:hypothetical protein